MDSPFENNYFKQIKFSVLFLLSYKVLRTYNYLTIQRFRFIVIVHGCITYKEGCWL
jgi:hypothetical protein